MIDKPGQGVGFGYEHDGKSPLISISKSIMMGWNGLWYAICKKIVGQGTNACIENIDSDEFELIISLFDFLVKCVLIHIGLDIKRINDEFSRLTPPFRVLLKSSLTHAANHVKIYSLLFMIIVVHIYYYFFGTGFGLSVLPNK